MKNKITKHVVNGHTVFSDLVPSDSEAKNQHGGPRPNSGRQALEDGRRYHKSIRVSSEVRDYLSAVGTGVIESLIRRSKAFREWRQRGPK